jgi:two-component system OmpR family response regulator
MRLLVVEDDPDLNRQLVSALSDAGYAVDTAFDGEEWCSISVFPRKTA